VNIFDLVDAGIEERSVPTELVFPEREMLRIYILHTKMFFAKECAKSNPLMEHFLIEVLVVRKRKPKQKPQSTQ